jgi:hypothetical protein
VKWVSYRHARGGCKKVSDGNEHFLDPLNERLPFDKNKNKNFVGTDEFLDTLSAFPVNPNIMETPLIPVSETRPKSLKSDQLVVEELGAELMIYDQARNQAFCLNQKAAFVWQHCDGKTTVSEIAARLSQSLGEPMDESIVEFALQNLSQDGLLETTTFLPFVPTQMTRRELMQKIGVRAVVALPLVTALVVAAPKAHASTGKGAPPPKKPPYHW